MMNVFNAVARRKSCRKYVMEPLPAETIDAIKNSINELKPLYPSVKPEWRFADMTKGLFNVKAPYYLIIGGQGTAGEKEAAGFLFQQLVLWLDNQELGSVWLGSSKDTDKDSRGNDFVTLALGRAAEAVHRQSREFIRKPIAEITNAPDDPCIQAARLAPSGLNLQPWYFEKNAHHVEVYRKHIKPPVSLVYKLTELDMGIALCHYALACEAAGKPFAFTRTTDIPEKPGFTPFGVIE